MLSVLDWLELQVRHSSPELLKKLTFLSNFEGTAPNLTWKDSGEPITCSFDPESNGDINAPNSIDPATFIDDNGSQYLIFGGGRIWMTQLDPSTGNLPFEIPIPMPVPLPIPRETN